MDDVTIGGYNLIVQIDEPSFVKRKYNRGNSVEGILVLGGIEFNERITYL